MLAIGLPLFSQKLKPVPARFLRMPGSRSDTYVSPAVRRARVPGRRYFHSAAWRRSVGWIALERERCRGVPHLRARRPGTATSGRVFLAGRISTPASKELAHVPPPQYLWLEPVIIAAIVVFVIDLIGNTITFSSRLINAIVTALVFAVVCRRAGLFRLRQRDDERADGTRGRCSVPAAERAQYSLQDSLPGTKPGMVGSRTASRAGNMRA